MQVNVHLVNDGQYSRLRLNSTPYEPPAVLQSESLLAQNKWSQNSKKSSDQGFKTGIHN